MKKGFTLIEILVTIVILTVVLLIAVPVYTGVSNNIKESIYESKIKEVLTKAESYASETNAFVFDIKTLIKEGKLIADSELGDYRDPRNRRDMQCDIINVVYKDFKYHVSIQESDVCYSLEELENLYGIFELKLYDVNDEEIEKIEGTEWIKHNVVKVKYHLKNEYENYEKFIVHMDWLGDEVKSCDINNLEECSEYVVTTDEIKNVTVSVQIRFKFQDIEIENKVSKTILIDRQEPYVEEGSIKLDNSIYTNNLRKVEFTVKDQNGSGIKEYAVITTSDCESEEYEFNKVFSSGGVETVYLKNGEYYICVKDRVGNTNDEENILNSKFQVINVNDEAGEIIYKLEKGTIGNNGWYKELAIKGEATSLSGVDKIITCITTEDSCEPMNVESISNGSYVKKMSSNSLSQRICSRVIDKAGNVSDIICSNAYKVDTVNPTVSFSIGSSSKGLNGWYKSLIIKATLSDSHSGVSSAKYCTTTGSTCTPKTNATLSNNGFTVSLKSNASAQKVCVEVTDKSGRTSGVKCSQTYKVDVTNPTAIFSIGNSSKGLNGWYKSLSVKISLSDGHSGVSSAKYCTTTGSTCTPGTNATISSNSFTVTLGSNASAQRVCVNVTDKSGRTSGIKCSGTYKVDTTNPTISSLNVVVNNSTAKVTVTGTDAHSGVNTYQFSKDNKTWYTTAANSYTFSNLSDGTYTIYARIVDKAGRISSIKNKQITIKIENPDDYDWSKDIACSVTKFQEAINSGRFANYIEHQQFRNAMYDCAETAAKVIRESSAAQKALRASSRFEIIEVHGRTGTVTATDKPSYDDTRYNPKDEDLHDMRTGAGNYMTTVYDGRALILSGSMSYFADNISPFNTTAWYCDLSIGSCEYYPTRENQEYDSGWGDFNICVGEAKKNGQFTCVNYECQEYHGPQGSAAGAGGCRDSDFDWIYEDELGEAMPIFYFAPSVGGNFVIQYYFDDEPSTTCSGTACDNYTITQKTYYKSQELYLQIFKI